MFSLLSIHKQHCIVIKQSHVFCVFRTLSTSEDELSHMKELCESSQKELAELLEKQAVQSEQVLQLTEKLKVRVLQVTWTTGTESYISQVIVKLSYPQLDINHKRAWIIKPITAFQSDPVRLGKS